MVTATAEKLTVTRDNVFSICDDQYANGLRPSYPSIKDFFVTPGSAKLKTYLSEWKEANPPLPTKAARDAQKDALITELRQENAELIEKVRRLSLENSTLRDQVSLD